MFVQIRKALTLLTLSQVINAIPAFPKHQPSQHRVLDGFAVQHTLKMVKAFLVLIISACVVTFVASHSPVSADKYSELISANPEDVVNILGGTDSRYDLSHGSTLPLVAMPWGFNTYAPQTDDDSNYKGWWFHPYDRRFFGLRVTHQPSPWIADYGNFLIKGYMPASLSSNSGADQYTGYSPKTTTYSPYFYETKLLAYSTAEENTVFGFAPSSHGGVVEVKFPHYDANAAARVGSSSKSAMKFADTKYGTAKETEEALRDHSGFTQTRRISIVLHGGADTSAISKSSIDGTTMLSGYTTANSGGVGDSNSAFAHYFVALVYGGEDGNTPVAHDATTSKASGNGVYVDFDPTLAEHQKLTVRFATSFISQEQALTNLLAEVNTDKSFGQVKSAAKSAWNQALSRVKVTALGGEETPDQVMDEYKKFYSALYRASLFPRSISEITSDGKEVHWSPYASSPEQRTASGPLTTDSGFWDAWNTVYPLLTLANRPKLGSLMQGWVNAYSEGGWIPQWASPGYRGSMVGTMGDVSIADAIVNEIPGFDVAKAYEAIRKDAFEIPPAGSNQGRECFDSYLTLGYVPQGACSEVTSRTLNYYQSDWAVAQAALKLGKTEDAATLLARASNYSLLFNQEDAFFRSRSMVDGKFTEPFDQFAWGGDYTEGGPWQFRFYLPYDPAGLDKLFTVAGKDMCTELEAVHTQRTAAFHIGGYSSEIHEMTEMTDHCWGQYAHNNQPIHHQLYMGMFKGYTSQCAANAQARIRQVLNNLYTSGSDMFPGDEDNGEMGAWYVLSSLGLYNLSPGGDEFLFGAPLFAHVEVDISDGAGDKRLVIKAVNNNKKNIYVQKITWNDAEIAHSANGIKYAQLKEGGTLTFYMGAAPVAAK